MTSLERLINQNDISVHYPLYVPVIGHAPAMQRSNDSHASARQRSHDSHASTADISPPDGAFGDTSSVTSSGVYVKRSVSLLGATAMVVGSIVGKI